MCTMYKTKMAEFSDLLAKHCTHPYRTVLFTQALMHVGEGQPVSLTWVPMKDGVLAVAVA